MVQKVFEPLKFYLHYFFRLLLCICNLQRFIFIYFFFSFQNNQLLLIDNEYTTEKINSGSVPGIKSVYESGDKEKKNTTIEISEDISAKTFVHVLEFLYSGIYNPLLDKFFKTND